jgi:cytidylate kinase
VPSAQVKSAILLAGLGATGETVVREPVATRSHTEEMLRACGVDVDIEPWGAGTVVRVHPGVPLPLDLKVPGDPSQAAFWVVAGAVVPGSEVVVENLYAGAARIGFIGVLGRMGADVSVQVEPAGTIAVTARYGPALQATEVAAAEIPSLDEVPALVVAAAVATGTTVFHDVAELRVKESDRLAAAVALAEAFGARAEIQGDDLAIRGIGPDGRLIPGRLDSGGDHRMAMAATIAGLAAVGEAPSVVTGFGAVGTSYPGFVDDLRTLGASVRVRGSSRPSAAGAEARPGPTKAIADGARLRPGEIVAIDGPAGSGKSTVSRALSRLLGVARLDTGAMYRSVAWAALDRGIDPADAPAVAELARQARIDVGAETASIDGIDVTAAIRSPEVSRAVSVVAANPDVRRNLVERQRRWAAEHGGGVVEGRDIGSVVFPDATLKVYLTAAAGERARRRNDESSEGVARRDHLDSTRAASPLFVAPGARVVDTTGRSVDEVVHEVASWL